jgi:plasmid stability protein
MKTLTLRGLDAATEKALRARAKAGSGSMNRAILEVLRESLGVTNSPRRVVHHDLDALAGTWSQADRHAFDKATQPLSCVEEDLWA